MSTKDQLLAMKAELESHVENLRALRKEAMLADVEDGILDEFGETIKFGKWMIANLGRIISAQPDEDWPSLGYRMSEAGIVPTSR